MMLRVSSPLCGSRVEYALDAVFFRKYLLRQNVTVHTRHSQNARCSTFVSAFS